MISFAVKTQEAEENKPKHLHTKVSSWDLSSHAADNGIRVYTNVAATETNPVHDFTCLKHMMSLYIYNKYSTKA